MPRGQRGGYGEYGYDNTLTETGLSSGFLQYLYYFIAVLIIGLVILVLVNYTLYPIFKTRPGGKGAIPLPGSDDSKLFWKDSKSLNSLNDTDTPVGSISNNWSMMMDIQVDNPTSNTNYPRVLFTRGRRFDDPKEPFGDTDTILKINPEFNLCIWLDRMTNDLNVTVQTVDGGSTAQPLLESISIPNIPVRKCIRLGVMVGSRQLEVYVNGYLVKTKTYTKDPRKVENGLLQPPLDNILSSTARVLNLRIWNRPVSPSEFRSYGGNCSFDLKELPDSCAAQTIGNVATQLGLST